MKNFWRLFLKTFEALNKIISWFKTGFGISLSQNQTIKVQLTGKGSVVAHMSLCKVMDERENGTNWETAAFTNSFCSGGYMPQTKLIINPRRQVTLFSQYWDAIFQINVHVIAYFVKIYTREINDRKSAPVYSKHNGKHLNLLAKREQRFLYKNLELRQCRTLSELECIKKAANFSYHPS